MGSNEAILYGNISIKGKCVHSLPIFKMNFIEIVDIALPAEGVFHNLVFGGVAHASRVSVSASHRNPRSLWMCPARRPCSPTKSCTASGAWAR